MTNQQTTCEYCNNTFPGSRTSCPHCARPQLFPNVANASKEQEKQQLDDRFNLRKEQCEGNGRSGDFERFHNAVESSHALFACNLEKLHRQIATGTDIFETYYQLEELRLRTTATDNLDWSKLRPQAEIELLGSHHNIEKLHYACLSLDWNNLTNYGDCVVMLKDGMIAHRASCFEGNSAVMFANRRNLEECLKSCWDDRGKIAVAVFADRLREAHDEDDFAQLLVNNGPSAIHDEFIEVHIFGTMTARTFYEVRFARTSTNRRSSVYRDAVIEKLELASVRHST